MNNRKSDYPTLTAMLNQNKKIEQEKVKEENTEKESVSQPSNNSNKKSLYPDLMFTQVTTEDKKQLAFEEETKRIQENMKQAQKLMSKNNFTIK